MTVVFFFDACRVGSVGSTGLSDLPITHLTILCFVLSNRPFHITNLSLGTKNGGTQTTMRKQPVKYWLNKHGH